MGPKAVAGAMRALFTSCALAGLIGQASAQTFVEHSAEVRLQLDFVMPDAALKTFLPAGQEPNIATSGAAKNCNLRSTPRIGTIAASICPEVRT